MARLTKTIIDATGAGDFDRFVWDAELRGFGLKVTPAGRKVYLVQYRAKDGKTKRVTIGVHGPTTADSARKQAQTILGEVAAGSDVAAKRRAAKNEARTAPTVEQAATEFLEQHVWRHLKTRTATEHERTISKKIIPLLGKIKVAELIHADVSRFHGKLAATPFAANRTVAVLASMLTWCIKQGYRPDRINVAHGLTKFAEPPRERFLTLDEIERLGAALREGETIGIEWSPIDECKPKAKHAPKLEYRRTVVDRYAVAAIRLLILTGARLREILHLKWSHVDLAAGVLRLADHKTSKRGRNKKVIVLSAPAAAVIAGLPRIENCEFVIAGAALDAPRADLKRPWSLVRARAGLDKASGDLAPVRLHDLRHTNASVGASSGVSLPLIGKLLGHSQVSTTARYAHLADDPVKQAAERIGGAISRVMGGMPAMQTSEVLPMRGRGR